MNPRVLFLNHSATMGGAEFGLMDVASHMRDRALVVLLEDGPFRERLEDAGIAVRVIDAGAIHGVRRGTTLPGAGAMLSLWRAGRDVAAIARDFDVIHANSQKALVVGSLAAKRARVPLVWHVHDIIDPPWFSRVNIMADVLLANSAERVIAVSKATAEAVVRHGVSKSRVHVVYNGIDAPKRDAEQTDRSPREELGIPIEAAVVGCFSRIAEWKGQHVLIEAVAELPEVHVLLVGGPLFGEQAYEKRLRDLVALRGMADRVHFTGHRADATRLMRAADLVVHPSTAPEPFARTLIEAMLAGKAPIASACGGVPELIESGTNGYLFPPGDVATLRRTIARLFASPDERERTESAAGEHARRNFTMSAFVEGVAQQLRAAAATRRNARPSHTVTERSA